VTSARITRARLLATLAFVAVVVAFLYLGLPNLVGLRATWQRLTQGDIWWLALAAVLEAISDFSYIALFRAVFVQGTRRVDWSTSYQITLASLVATRVLAAGGAGGIALTAWALRRAGMDARTVAVRMVAFNVILYSIYMGALVVGGLGLYLGLFAGPGPFAITVVPAIFGGVVILLVLAISLIPGNFERLVSRWAARTASPRATRLLTRIATGPAAAAAGVREAISVARSGDPMLLGALGSWGFDIATLWACFHAFGASPHWSVIVLAYFVGWIANLLPLPGGVGGVEGGMIGAFSALGVPVGDAIVAVLAYRAFAFWGPMLPGAVAYVQLRHTVSTWREDAPEHSYTL
jgi:uncharacterized protein (TIRG00374 family)